MVITISLNQNDLNYLINLVESSEKKDWDKAIKDLKLNMHPDSLRKSFNVGEFSGYNVYKYMQDKLEKECFSSEETERLEALRDKEFKERVKLQDANREKRKWLREFSRVESIMEYIDKKISEREPLKIKKTEYKIKSGNEAALLVSDLHTGAKFNNIINDYDIDVLKDRLNQLADKTIAYCKRDCVDLLHIEIIGDIITGIIHGSTIAEAQEDVIDQIFIACDLLEEFILKLYKYIPQVDVYITYGNHGRIHSNKSDGQNKENFERLIAPYIRKDFRDLDIKVYDGGIEDFVCYRLRDGRPIVVTHGTNDKYSSANKNFTKMLGEDIFEIHMGHYHNPIEQNGTVVNGSVMGSDDYAVSHRLICNPTQLLKVYIDDDTTTHKLVLN